MQSENHLERELMERSKSGGKVKALNPRPISFIEKDHMASMNPSLNDSRNNSTSMLYPRHIDSHLTSVHGKGPSVAVSFGQQPSEAVLTINQDVVNLDTIEEKIRELERKVQTRPKSENKVASSR